MDPENRSASVKPPGAAPPAPKRHRSPWPWICALLALVGIGLLIWALSVKSDNDDTQAKLDTTEQELASTQKELDSAKQEAAQPAESDDSGGNGGAVVAVGAFATAKALYQDLADQLGATEEDLAATQQDLETANDKAAQAEKDAEAAKQQAEQAGNETDKAKAEANQAKAEADAAESKATVARDCAKAYISAFGTLFEGKDVKEQAAAVRKQLQGITADCKSALADS
jgi:multidrug resistance efflux pump